MLRDISADERVEPACRHAQFAENFAAEILAGFIGCVGHQDVVALLNECQNGVGDRRRAARKSAHPAPPSSSHMASWSEKWVSVPRRP